MSLWAQWSLKTLLKWDDLGGKTHYFPKHPCFWVFLLSIQSMPAKIHWSVGNALAHFSGRDSPQNRSCSGEIKWGPGLQNLCNNSNKHLGGETSKFFFLFGIHPWKKKRWGRLIIYISNEMEHIFLQMGWLKKTTNNSNQESSLRGEPASAVRYQVEDQGWAGHLRCIDPAEDVGGAPADVGGANGFVKKPRGVGQDWLVVVFFSSRHQRRWTSCNIYIYIYIFFFFERPDLKKNHAECKDSLG